MIKRVMPLVLILLLGVHCTKRGDSNPTGPTPGGGTKSYVKAVDIYMGDVTTEEAEHPFLRESIEFKLDSKNRITNIRGVEYNDANEIVDEYADINLDYNDGDYTLMVTTTMDGEDVAVECDLNDRGAITTARWMSPEDVVGLVEDFVYNDSGELVTYTLSLGNMVGISLDYEWKDGNIVGITSEDMSINDSFTYIDEPNPYNIDMFYAYAWNMPMLAEVILIHDGLFGNTNRSMLKSCRISISGEEVYEEFTHKFKDGLVEYTKYEDAIIRYRCF